MTKFNVGDQVIIKSSRTFSKSITGTVAGIDLGNTHTPEVMVCVDTGQQKVWVYAWRLEKQA